MIYHSRKIQSKISRGKRYMRWSRDNQLQAYKSPLPPHGALRIEVNSSSQELWQHVWNVFYQLSSLEIQRPRILLVVDHVGTLCLAHRKFLDSQKEYKCSTKPHCLYKQFEHSEPSLLVRELWHPSGHLRSQMPDESQTCKQVFLKIAATRPATLSFSCTVGIHWMVIFESKGKKQKVTKLGNSF